MVKNVPINRVQKNFCDSFLKINTASLALDVK